MQDDKKNILVLNYDDSRGGGVIWTFTDKLKKMGHNIFEMPYLKTNEITKNYFVDRTNKRSYSYLKFKVINLYIKIISKIFIKKDINVGFNSHYYNVKALDILNKCSFNPDIIIIGWYDYYLTPKTIFNLHKLTGAKIVISMIDEFLLGGGCHYPFDCTQYITGCKNCESLRFNKHKSSNLWDQKNRYITSTPLVVVGTSYDLMCLKCIDAFKDVRMYKNVGVPKIPFVLSKTEARQIFNVPLSNFCILFGATNFNDKRKGLTELLNALSLFNEKYIEDRNVTILMLGSDDARLDLSRFNDKINFVKTGYISREMMYKAYYACDIFVSPTLADSGPYMINYSAACGRPIVSFPIGVAVDLVIPGKTGYLAKYKDIEDLAKGIQLFYKMGVSEIDKYSSNCINLMSQLDSEQPWYTKILD